MRIELIGGIGPAATEFYYRGLVKPGGPSYFKFDEPKRVASLQRSRIRRFPILGNYRMLGRFKRPLREQKQT